MSSTGSNSSSDASIRWWPAVVVVVLVAGLMIWIWLQGSWSLQQRITASYPTLFFGAVLLFAWLVLFSRLPRRLRSTIFLVVSLAVGLAFLLFEITGVDGNLVPILGFRWSSERSFASDGVSLGGVTEAGPNDYPQFYGPGRSLKLPDTALERDWQTRPPREIWRREVGEGWSSFAVVGEAAITQEQRGGNQWVVRYDLRTGAQVWASIDGESFVTTVGGRGPRATPTVVEGAVYSLNANGDLGRRDLDSGRVVWTRNVLADHATRPPDWGMASSPLVVGEVVMVQLGRNGVGLAGYDRKTGDQAWHAGETRGTYSSPFLARVLGRDMALIVNHTGVAGHDPRTGEIVLTAEWPNPSGGERITMPLMLASDRMMVSAGYGVGSALFSLAREGDRVVGHLLWQSPRLKSKFAPMVFHEGVVFGLDEGVLVAFDPASGERLWKKGRYGHGQMILVGSLLLIQAENGDVVLVEANPREPRELGRISALGGKTWNPPALSGNLLLVRNNTEAACYELPLENGDESPVARAGE